MKLNNDYQFLWRVLGLVALLTVIFFVYNEIALIVSYHSVGMSLKKAIDAFFIRGLLLVAITLLVGIAAFFRWRLALLFAVIVSYQYVSILKEILTPDVVVIYGPWVWARNMSAITGTMISVVGLILIILYIKDFFARKH